MPSSSQKPTSSRKQRELEARENLILDVAERMVMERGYLGTNMDLIAEAVEYSKGTIYQHFANKEELLCALTVRLAGERVRLFERAATFQGRSRERMVAVGVSLELFARLYPQHFQIEQIVTADSIRTKSSEKCLSRLEEREAACQGIVTGIVRDALARGDLVMPDDTTPAGLVSGLWMTTYGGLALTLGKGSLEHLGLSDPPADLRRTQNAILDGYGWRPLLAEWDYDASRRRAMEEVFPDEARRAGAL